MSRAWRKKDVDMLHRALTAFVEEDVEAAQALPIEDDEVDALYNQVYRELMTFVIADPRPSSALIGCCGWHTTWSAWPTA